MVKAIITDVGGKTSHSAIIASALGIPCVVGLESATEDITSGDKVIVDGVTGIIIINPDEATLKRYQAMQRNYYLLGRKLTKQYKQLPAITKDGTKIEVVANIGSPDEIPNAIDHGAEGVGLYRTEFIFFDNDCQPTEEIHVQEYRRAIQALGNRKLVIRTLDLGADKIPVDGVVCEANPFLGLRAIRLCFQRVDIFTTQLRAIYKVSNYGNVQVMFPMISALEEILKIKEIMSQVASELEEEGIPFDKNIKIGVMLETPAIMMSLDSVLKEVDFVSIGTNDLVAYTMAVDRTNDKVAYLYQHLHPAILRMLKESIDMCNKHKKPVSLCGEMSSEAMYTMLLLGLGLRSFSVVPPVIPEIKKVICSTTIEEAKKITKKTMSFRHVKDAEEFLRTETRKIIPDML
jgi:phosphotransferase system enzyme I (PtsI)